MSRVRSPYWPYPFALIAQLGERQTEDLKVLCSIHSQGTVFSSFSSEIGQNAGGKESDEGGRRSAQLLYKNKRKERKVEAIKVISSDFS